MANYQATVRLRPEVRDFIRHRRWVHRGDVVAYGPNIRCASFSTDATGFRHSSHGDRDYSVADYFEQPRYGIVLGPSSVYGFGLAGNQNTIPSVLAERFGFPFANVGFPEGSSRTLFAMLFAFVARAKRPPSIVLHVSGGDFTSFCYTSVADPVFGPPNLLQMKRAIQERGGVGQPTSQMGRLIAFTSLWTRAIAQMCRARNIPLVLADDTTFFEKESPSEIDIQCGLGVPSNTPQRLQFETHCKHGPQFHAVRLALAKNLDIPIAGPGRTNSIGFVDEFHYDREGTLTLCGDYAAAIAPLL